MLGSKSQEAMRPGQAGLRIPWVPPGSGNGLGHFRLVARGSFAGGGYFGELCVALLCVQELIDGLVSPVM